MGGTGSGGRPKPTALKILAGNPGGRRLNKHEPKPSANVMPECPDWLSDDAKAEWKKTGPILFRLGVLTELDVTAFAAFCRAVGMLKDADAHLRREGMIVVTPQGPVMNPWQRIAVQSLKEVKAFGIEFGITPSSRSRLAVAPVASSDDPDDAMFGTAR